MFPEINAEALLATLLPFAQIDHASNMDHAEKSRARCVVSRQPQTAARALVRRSSRRFPQRRLLRFVWICKMDDQPSSGAFEVSDLRLKQVAEGSAYVRSRTLD
jgi:hypothetical protein